MRKPEYCDLCGRDGHNERDHKPGKETFAFSDVHPSIRQFFTITKLKPTKKVMGELMKLLSNFSKRQAQRSIELLESEWLEEDLK
jgi:hypothetical protein